MNQVRGIRLYVSSTAAIAAGCLLLPPGNAQSRKALAVTMASPASAIPTASPAPEAVASARDKFRKLSERQQQKVLTQVRAAVASIDSAYLRSLQPFCADGRKTAKPRYKALRGGGKGAKSETAHNQVTSIFDPLPLKARSEYRFAYGDIAPRALVRTGKRVSRRTKNKASALAELDSLLSGFAVDTDFALAALLRKLDNDRSGDQHAVFLDSWKNGKETFYAALARTAGTGRGVFCYDAMLSDWVRRCIPKKSAASKMMMRSLDNAQKAFYQTAATYRAYRSVREVVALTLVLPADVRLPGRLGKLYQDNGGSGYSTRDAIELILAANQNDVAKTVEMILTHLERMPPAPWKAGFDGVHGIFAAQDLAMDQLATGGRSTDAALAKRKQESRQLRDRIARVAASTFLAAL